jgi:hypothetical protein
LPQLPLKKWKERKKMNENKATGNKFITIFRAGQKGKPIEIQREETADGETVCFCVQYRGGGRYFSTEAECFAYAYGRGLIDRSENPWLFGGSKCTNRQEDLA